MTHRSTFGPAYDPTLDGERLRTQREIIRDAMLSAGECGNWHTLAEIEMLCSAVYSRKFPQASISAQLRHLRKRAFGSYVVLRRRRGHWRNSATWEYQVRPPAEERQQELPLEASAAH